MHFSVPFRCYRALRFWSIAFKSSLVFQFILFRVFDADFRLSWNLAHSFSSSSFFASSSSFASSSLSSDWHFLRPFCSHTPVELFSIWYLVHLWNNSWLYIIWFWKCFWRESPFKFYIESFCNPIQSSSKKLTVSRQTVMVLMF